jgi:hypothetical protein
MIAAEGKMTITLRDEAGRTIPLPELAGCVRPGCKACADFSAKLSDLSIGSIGNAFGMSTVLIRTPEGMGLFKIAEEMGFIEAWDGVNVKAIKKQAGSSSIGTDSNRFLSASCIKSNLIFFFDTENKWLEMSIKNDTKMTGDIGPFLNQGPSSQFSFRQAPGLLRCYCPLWHLAGCPFWQKSVSNPLAGPK